LALTAAPIATGWSDPVAGWELHPLKTKHLFTAHTSCVPFSSPRMKWWMPGREVLGQVAPWRPGPDKPTEGVEDVTEVVHPLAGVLGEQAEVGQDELPFGVGDVAGVGLVSDHTLNYARATAS
jgi:hypothetical protein